MTDREKLLDWCKKKCNNPELLDENGFSIVLDRLEKLFASAGITSESLGDYSQSYGATLDTTIMGILSPYKRLKML